MSARSANNGDGQQSLHDVSEDIDCGIFDRLGSEEVVPDELDTGAKFL